MNSRSPTMTANNPPVTAQLRATCWRSINSWKSAR